MKRLIKGQLVIWVYKENILGIMLSAFLFGGVVWFWVFDGTVKKF